MSNLSWNNHEFLYCQHVNPPEGAKVFDTYKDAYEAKELEETPNGYMNVTHWEDKYYIWRN